MPQCIVQFGQPYVATRASLSRSPSIFQASGCRVSRKLRTGNAATSLHQAKTPVVPWTDQPLSLSIARTFFRSPVPTAFIRSGSATGMDLVPLTTMALSLLEPITAPMPGRPPARPSRLRTTA